VDINFDNASVVRSNLGGQGGRCASLNECDEIETPTTPHEVLIRDIGTNTLGSSEPIDMRITNITEYHAWRTRWNGVKRTGVAGESSFGVVNLLGPRDPTQSGFIWTAK